MVAVGKDNAPCLGCGDRRPGCHGSCELYARFAAITEERRNLANADKQRDLALNDFTIRGKLKALRASGRRAKR